MIEKMPYGNVSSYCNYSERGSRQVGTTTKLKQSLPAINREAFTFQPELRSGYYTPMRERPFVEQSQGTVRPLAFEIKLPPTVCRFAMGGLFSTNVDAEN